MKKIKEFVQKNTKYLLLGIGIPFVLYLLMEWFHGYFISFPLYLQIRNISHWVLAILGLSFFPIALLSNNKWGVKILIIAGILPVCFFFGLGSTFASYEILDTNSLNNKIFHLVYWYENYDDAFTCSLYRCDPKGKNCKSINSSIHYDCYNLGHEPELIIDPISNELHVQYTNYGGYDYLVYTYGSPSRRYDYVSFPIDDDEFYYYVGYVRNYSDSGHPWNAMFYQCEKDYSHCERLPFEYSRGSLNLEKDEESGVFSIFHNNTLIYTYDGKTGTCYVDECSLID